MPARRTNCQRHRSTLLEREPLEVGLGIQRFHVDMVTQMNQENQNSDESVAPVELAPMSIEFTRRELLKEWMAKRNQTISDVAAAYGCKLPYVRSILHLGDTKRNIGEKAARKLEKSLKMPERYLDGESDTRVRLSAAPRPIGDSFPVPRLVAGKTGARRDAEQSVWLPQTVLDFATISPEHAAWVRVESNELSPKLPINSLALVHCGETSISDGKLYALFWRGQLILRRVHMRPEGYFISVDSSPATGTSFSEADWRSQMDVAGHIRMAMATLD